MVEGGCVRTTGDDGPCHCSCHDGSGVKHMMPCCSFSGMSRAEATILAVERSAAETTTDDDTAVTEA